MISLLKVENQVVRFVEMIEGASGFRLDVRYARRDNFVSRKVYHSAQVFLLEHVASDLEKVHAELKHHGFGLLLFDGYRPWSVSKLFWDLSSPEDRAFLANPAKGSSHNRGCAVDLSLYDLRSGSPVKMPSDFDEMNEKAFSNYPGGDEPSREARDLLKAKMEANGFQGIPNEWWHFNHQSRKDWPIMNFSFEEISKAPKIQRQLQQK